MIQPPHTEIIPATFTTRGKGQRRFCGPVNDYGLQAVQWGWPYEWQRQERVMGTVARGGSFVEIGAHIGTDTVPLSDHFAGGHAFEPSSENFACLCYNLELNSVAHVQPRRAAFSDVPGRAEFHLAGATQSISHSLNPALVSPGATETVDVLTLDALSDIRDCTFVHIDAEGHDLKILDGGHEFVRRQRQRPVFCLEFAPQLLTTCGSSLDGLAEFVRAFDYLPYDERANLMAPSSMANLAEHFRLWQAAPIWLNLWLVPPGLCATPAFPGHLDAPGPSDPT